MKTNHSFGGLLSSLEKTHYESHYEIG